MSNHSRKPKGKRNRFEERRWEGASQGVVQPIPKFRHQFDLTRRVKTVQSRGLSAVEVFNVEFGL